MGFLKGRFSSLRGLRVQINQPSHIHVASLWITTCIILHSFAMDHEAGMDVASDEFFHEGLRIMEEEKRNEAEWRQERENEQTRQEAMRDSNRDVELIRARLKREELKVTLFEELDL